MKKFLGLITIILITSISLSFAESLQVKPKKEKTIDSTEKPIKGNVYFGFSIFRPSGYDFGLCALGARSGPFGVSGIFASLGHISWYSIEPSLFLQLNKGFALQALVGYTRISMGQNGFYINDYAGTIYGLGFQIYVKKLMLGCTFRTLGRSNSITNGFFMLNFGASIK